MRLTVRDQAVFIGTGSRSLEAGGAERAVVFLHGAGLDHSVWVMPARHFARHGFAVLAPDFPGHGRSGGAPLESIPAMAEWLAELLDTLAIECPSVVGHSMGALVAQAFARRHPDRCRSLALLGAALPMRVSEPLLAAARDDDHAAIDMANTWSHTRGELGGSDNPGQWMLAVGERLMEACAPGVFHADLAACNGFDPDAEPGPIRSPTLVIAGAEDRMTPRRAGQAVADGLADARLVVVPGCGHSMLNERPNEVLDALRDFLL